MSALCPTSQFLSRNEGKICQISCLMCFLDSDLMVKLKKYALRIWKLTGLNSELPANSRVSQFLTISDPVLHTFCGSVVSISSI